ncbi:hypothetical protein [Pedobacter terrae]|uniref:hypothetical protein n=1 Tax=Pedobacter terrae TaxID=405671 RepID=UPI002FF8C1E7
MLLYLVFKINNKHKAKIVGNLYDVEKILFLVDKSGVRIQGAYRFGYDAGLWTR